MCVAVVTKPGKSLTDDMIEKGWNVNSDGGGFAYIKDGLVRIHKGLMDLDKFKSAYHNAVDDVGKDSPFLIHFRIRTSGMVDQANTHPFRINPQKGPGGAVIHNGVLFYPDYREAGNRGKSDTRILCESLNNVLALEDLQKSKTDLNRALSGNKMAFLYDTGDYVIINEESGFWNDDMWFSNGSCGTYRRGSR